MAALSTHAARAASSRGGGAAVLEREGAAATARRVEEMHPSSFELFTEDGGDAWAREFTEFAKATEGLDSLASLQAELMSTVATMDSLLLAPLPAPSGGSQEWLDQEARRAKRQRARAARKTRAPAAAAAATTTLVLEPPPADLAASAREQLASAVQPPAPLDAQQAPQRQQRRAAAELPAAGVSLPAAGRAAAAAATPAGLALSSLLQQQGPGLALPAPAVPLARAANQARSSRNSAGRAAVAKDVSQLTVSTLPAANGSTLTDGTTQFFKMSSAVGLLKPEQQKEVAAVVKDYLSLKSVEKELRGILKRPPTTAEWAKAMKMDPRSFQVRLQHGQDAKALMLKANYRLVVKVVKAYQNRGLSLQDLITEGMHGLVKGVEKFDADKGFRFSTYAHWWIRQAVTRALQDQGRPVRLPTHLHEHIVRISMASSTLMKKLARQPTMAEISKVVGMPADKVAELLAASCPSSSLEVSSVGGEDDNASEAKDMLADDRAQPDEVMESHNLASSIEAALTQALTPREASILRMHWGLDGAEMTLEEIGTRIGVTRERVRQLEARAIRKLKECQLDLTAGVLGELQGISTLESERSTARASRGTKKT